jgi:hypothetical protein
MSTDFELIKKIKNIKMEKIESLEEFYKRKFNWLPENLRNEIGHFNILRIEPLIGENGKPVVPYKRRDFYKIMLVKGNSKVHYADKVIEVKNRLSLFPILIYPINGSMWMISGAVFSAFSIRTSSMTSATLTNMRFSSPMVTIFLN